MKRLFIVGASALAAVAVPATMLVTAGTANAAGNQITCTKLAGGATTQSLSKCTGPSAILAGEKAGKGTGTSVVTVLSPDTASATTTWGAGGAGGTSTSDVSDSITSGGACGAKDETISESATTVSGTGAAVALEGDTGTATICYSAKTGKVTLLKGTTIGG